MGWNPKKTYSQVTGGTPLPTPSAPISAFAKKQWGINVPNLQGTMFDPNKALKDISNLGQKSKYSGGPDAQKGAALPTPELGAWQSLNPEDIKSLYKVNTLDQQAIANDMQNSPWYKMALEKQAAEQNQLYNQATQQAATSNAQAQANLAARGGLRGGAAERLASQSGENLALARQNLLGQSAIERGNLGMQSLDRAVDINKFNTGQATQANIADVNAALQNNAAKNEQDRLKYSEAMKLKAAGMTGDAMAKGGGKK